MRFALWASAAVISCTFYVGWRLLGPFRGRRRWQLALWLTLTCLACFALCYPIFRRLGWPLPNPWLVFLSGGVLVFLGQATLARDVVWGALAVVRWSSRAGRRAGLGPAGGGAGRRWAQGSAIVAAGTAAVLCCGSFYGARRRPPVVAVRLALSDLPAELENFRVVLISDLHVGFTIGRSFVQSVVVTVNGLHPDLVAVAGDLTDGSVADLRHRVAPLARLRARHGAFFVTGNHEYYWGDALGWIEEVRRLGITPLVNEHRLVPHGGATFAVAGVTDPVARHYVPAHTSRLAQALEGIPEGTFRLLLSHRPTLVRGARRLGCSLLLAGHSHGGQIFPLQVFLRYRRRIQVGLHRSGNLWVYASRGTGYWGLPFRFGAPSEITLLTLHRSAGAEH